MTEPISRTVDQKDDGIRLDMFLANQPEVGSRGLARRLLDTGMATIAGGRVRPGQRLTAGQTVAFRLPRRTDPLAPEQPLPDLRILYEDEWLCAIDKPPGLAAHPPDDRDYAEHTVASWALARYGNLPSVAEARRPGIVHRLDRDTSGVMVVARTEAALEGLRAQWKARSVEKEYRCIVFGEPRFQSDWIEKPLATDPRHPDRMTVVEQGGRDSSTFYEVVERFAGFAHVRCRPKTGRTHQIRVHMTSIGHSLVGDRVYRSRLRQHDVVPPEAPGPRRQCLHALRLALLHPHTHEPIEFTAELPLDMQHLLTWLRHHRPPAR